MGLCAGYHGFLKVHRVRYRLIAVPPRQLAPPLALDERSSLAGLRTIAFFEAVKGVGVLILMAVIISIHSRVDEMAENLLYDLHMDPDRKLGEAFLNAAWRLGDMRLFTVITMAVSYSIIRFIESWGLWHRRVWAEWFALLSGSLYLPWEIAKLIQEPSWFHASVLIINVVIVGYMLYVRIASLRSRILK